MFYHRQPINITSFPFFLRKQAYENKVSNNMNAFESVLVSNPKNNYLRKKKRKRKKRERKQKTKIQSFTASPRLK